MAVEDNKNSFKGLRSYFLSGGVKKMRDIVDMSPTNIAKELGINHSRYIHKLNHPEEFNFEHIWRLSKILEIDVQIIINVIIKEISISSKVHKK